LKIAAGQVWLPVAGRLRWRVPARCMAAVARAVPGAYASRATNAGVELTEDEKAIHPEDHG